MVVVRPNMPGGGNPPVVAGLPFCGFDPSWASDPILLNGTFNPGYGGMVLYGACPRCEHADGINVFIPTTWATTTSVGAPGASFVSAAALGSNGSGPRNAVQWVGPDSKETGLEAKAGEVIEIVVCRCSKEHEHQPPSGKTGCGYWTYLHLQKGAIPDGE